MASLFLQTYAAYARSVMFWLAIGIGAAYIAEKKMKPGAAARYFGTFDLRHGLAAIALGMISPLSIMPALPVAGQFIAWGANPALFFSFLAAERAYDFNSFPIIAGLFGARFAAINAAAVFVSLLAAAWSIRKRPVRIASAGAGKGAGNGFAKRQLRMVAIVAIGIAIGAFFRVLFPQDLFVRMAGSPAGGMASGTLFGFFFYFGTILGNYPVARSFADLGMSKEGVFAFLTVSPLLNIIVMSLFASIASWRTVLRFFGAYAATAIALTFIAVRFL